MRFDRARLGGNAPRGWLYRDYAYQGDRPDLPSLETEALLGRSRDNAEPITFTCAPPGDGRRSVLPPENDRMRDGNVRSVQSRR